MDKISDLNALHYQCSKAANLQDAIKQLETIGFTGIARADRKPIIITLPFAWNSIDPNDRNWMFQLHSWRMLDPYMHAMLIDTISAAYFDHCIRIVTDWIRENVLGSGCSFTWYDMSVGVRASKLALLAHVAPLCDRELANIPGFDATVTNHFKHLCNPKELRRSNHGLFQMQGLKSLASAFPGHPQALHAQEYAIRIMGELIESQMGPNFVHVENSPGYHIFACNRINTIIKSPDWQLPEMAFARDLMLQASYAIPWLIDLNNMLIPVGDTPRKKVDPHLWPSLLERPHQAGLFHIGATVDGYGVVRSKPDQPLTRSTYLMMMAAYRTPSHKHDDCLSLLWQECGSDILIDSGSFSYQKDDYRSYFISRRAHNTIEINGESISDNKRGPYGIGLQSLRLLSTGIWEVLGEVPCNKAGNRIHQRRVLFLPSSSDDSFRSDSAWPG